MNDACDIFLEAAKLAAYARREALSSACYCAFAATWAVLRMGYSGAVVLPAVWGGAWGLVARYGASDVHVGLWAVCVSLLGLLQLQHACWWYYIARKIHPVVRIEIVNRVPGGGAPPVAVQRQAAAVQ